MAGRGTRRLTSIQIKNGTGRLADGGGLILFKADKASGKWIFRYSHLGKRREMGLGTWPAQSLADAGTARDEWASVLAAGRDPISEREAAREAEKRARDADDPTFADMVDAVFEARKATLRGGGTRGRWMSPLTLYMIPALGRKRMSAITQLDVADALRPIWKTKHPTAEKAIQRTRIVFREAKLMGIDCDPFVVDAAERRLGAVLRTPTPTPSTPWQDVPDLYRRLAESELVSALALRFALLTLVRADGIRKARFAEIEDGVWTVPADRVKGREGKVEDFRVPLSDEAMAVALRAGEFSDDLLFPGRMGNPVTHTALEKRLNEMGEAGRPHGFRASFRSWVQDTDACAWEVAEKVLGHTVGGKVERSYARSDLLERRRPVMEAWARHVTGAESSVVSLAR